MGVVTAAHLPATAWSAPAAEPYRCPYCEDGEARVLVFTVGGWACPVCDEVGDDDLAPVPVGPTPTTSARAPIARDVQLDLFGGAA